eukprot:11609-Heterococcus_DN1.PRE.2
MLCRCGSEHKRVNLSKWQLLHNTAASLQTQQQHACVSAPITYIYVLVCAIAPESNAVFSIATHYHGYNCEPYLEQCSIITIIVCALNDRQLFDTNHSQRRVSNTVACLDSHDVWSVTAIFRV